MYSSINNNGVMTIEFNQPFDFSIFETDERKGRLLKRATDLISLSYISQGDKDEQPDFDLEFISTSTQDQSSELHFHVNFTDPLEISIGKAFDLIEVQANNSLLAQNYPEALLKLRKSNFELDSSLIVVPPQQAPSQNLIVQ